jgi:predicted RNase H-like HicB family nuclease
MALSIYFLVGNIDLIQIKWRQKNMKFDVAIEQDGDNVWIVECPAIKGCVSQVETKEKALENIRDVIVACFKSLWKEGCLWL